MEEGGSGRGKRVEEGGESRGMQRREESGGWRWKREGERTEGEEGEKEVKKTRVNGKTTHRAFTIHHTSSSEVFMVSRVRERIREN